MNKNSILRGVPATIKAKISLIISLGIFSINAYAIDINGPKPMEANTLGGIYSADPIKEDAWNIGASLGAKNDSLPAQKALGKDVERGDDAGKYILKKEYQLGVHLGFGITKDLDLGTSFFGSMEEASPQDRDNLFKDKGEEWRAALKETGFSGAAIKIKYRLLDWQGLRLSLMPYVMSGVGNLGQYALTRSFDPEGGWFAIATYGQKGLGEVSFNTGYYYRKPDILGNLTLRNEIIYQGSLAAYLTKSVSLFAVGKGKRIMIKDLAKNDEKYSPYDVSAFGGGIKGNLDDLTLSAYYLANSKQERLGFARNEIGLGVSYLFKEGLKGIPEKDEENQADEKYYRETNKKYKTVYPRPEDDLVFDFDMDQPSSGEKDDFDKLKEKYESERKSSQGKLSEEEKLEIELEKLHQAEAKKRAEEEKQKREQEKMKRARSNREWQEEERISKELEKEADDRAARLKSTITDEDVNWKGLE